VAPGLARTVDYGWLTFLSQPLFWLLDKINWVFGNWGWSIIALTLLIKLAFWKLSETSYRSMARMRKVAPRMKALQERYKDDRQRLNQAMMDLYKTEKINPLGGCLPILVQIPVFIALYWVLLESVELRQAPWALWIQDLSSRDPFFVLPVLMGASMLLQQKLNPPPPDPVQAKIMMFLPIVFTVFFAFFPAGLVLYWFVNNLISLGQQWYITRKIEAGAVTVLGAEAPHNVNDHGSTDADGLLTTIAGTLATLGSNNLYLRGPLLLVLSPEHAALFAGWSRADVQAALCERATVDVSRVSAGNLERFARITPALFDPPPADGRVPILDRPDDLLVIVAGGPGKHSLVLPTFGSTAAVTVPLA
jgi:YidC/Oxa1 family membrane protein insertase